MTVRLKLRARSLEGVGDPTKSWLSSAGRCRSKWCREKEEMREGRGEGERRKKKEKKKEKKNLPRFDSGLMTRFNFTFAFPYQNISLANFARIFNVNKYGSVIN